jgi:hypothetical protein
MNEDTTPTPFDEITRDNKEIFLLMRSEIIEKILTGLIEALNIQDPKILEQLKQLQIMNSDFLRSRTNEEIDDWKQKYRLR